MTLSGKFAWRYHAYNAWKYKLFINDSEEKKPFIGQILVGSVEIEKAVKSIMLRILDSNLYRFLVIMYQIHSNRKHLQFLLFSLSFYRSLLDRVIILDFYIAYHNQWAIVDLNISFNGCTFLQ